jgi:hypothetical protein
MSTIGEVRAAEQKVQRIRAALKNSGAQVSNKLAVDLRKAADDYARVVREFNSRISSPMPPAHESRSTLADRRKLYMHPLTSSEPSLRVKYLNLCKLLWYCLWHYSCITPL